MKRVLAAMLTMTAVACGVDTTTSVATTADALETAQCDFGGFEAVAQACRATYDACVAAEGADVAVCRAALHECLPPPPDHAGRGGDCDGGQRPPRGPRPELDGGMPPPPPRDLDGGHGGRHGGRGPHPDPAAIQSCRDALASCQAADPTDVTCVETEHACVRAAFEAAFQAACDEATVRCASETSEACTRILARCADGVGGTNASCQ